MLVVHGCFLLVLLNLIWKKLEVWLPWEVELLSRRLGCRVEACFASVRRHQGGMLPSRGLVILNGVAKYAMSSMV